MTRFIVATRMAVVLASALLVGACGAGATPSAAPPSIPTPVASPVTTATPAPTVHPTPEPTPTPAPATAGPPDQAVHVTGTETVLAVTEAGTRTTANGVEQMRGLVAATTDTMSDPRVSGSGTIGGDYDRWLQTGAATQWGTYRLENDGGSWVGTWAGIAYPGAGMAPIEDATAWLVGEGGYAGLTYYLHFHGSGGTYEIDGMVFPGTPPAP